MTIKIFLQWWTYMHRSCAVNNCLDFEKIDFYGALDITTQDWVLLVQHLASFRRL